MNKEVLDKISKCSSVEEVLELAKSNGKNVTREQAEEVFNMTHSEGELSDDEISSVSGGASGCDRKAYVNEYYYNKADVQFVFTVGEQVEVFLDCDIGNETQQAHISKVEIHSDNMGRYYDVYYPDAGKNKGIALHRSHFEKK